MSNYLDNTGLAYFWGKIKDRLNLKADYAWTEKMASGNLVQFEDGEGGTLFSKLNVNIIPEDGRSGTVEPTNPGKIGGFTGLKVTSSGKNLFDKNNYEKIYISCTATSGSTTATVAGVGYQACWIPLPGGITYAISCSTHSSNAFRVTATAEKPVSTNTYKSPALLTITDPSSDTIIFPAPAGTRWLGLSLRTTSSTDVTTIDAAVEGLQIEVASAATAYEAFKNKSLNISFSVGAGTVYAGTYDVINGKLTVTHAYAEFDGTETWQQADTGTYPYYYTVVPSAIQNTSYGWSSHFPWTSIRSNTNNYGIDAINGTGRWVAVRPNPSVAASLSAFTTWLASQASSGYPLQVVYPILKSSVVTYNLPGNAISVLEGTNRVWSLNGDIDVGYTTGLYAKIKSGDEGIRSMISSGETAMVASKNYVVGERFSVGNTLYKATTAIASGEVLVPGTNVTATSVADELNAIMPATGVSF